MAYMEWSDQFSVQVAEIDQQHRKLIDMVNALHQAMREKKTREILGKVIEGLIGYVQIHFATEEKYFEQFDYPESAAHKKEHRAFTAKVSDFKQGFDEGRVLLSIEVMDFMENWLVTHIQGSDKKYGPFFNTNGLT